MIKCLLFFFFISIGSFSEDDEDRVKKAYAAKFTNLKKELNSKGINPDSSYKVFLRAFKESKELEVWIKSFNNSKFIHLKTYQFCRSSGTLGPKIKEGDGQTPEGIYYINRFNPKSNFHLSLGINYPNETDLRRSANQKPGGNIFIHGSCVTIGCIPVTDDGIQELYLLCKEAKDKGQNRIPVHIFPFRLTTENINFYSSKFENEIIAFWKTLQPYFLNFEKNKQLN